jgi:hypothetical protein
MEWTHRSIEMDHSLLTMFLNFINFFYLFNLVVQHQYIKRVNIFLYLWIAVTVSMLTLALNFSSVPEVIFFL